MKLLNAFKIFAVFSFCISTAFAEGANFGKIPGTVIAYSPASGKKYLGSPSLCVLPDGSYVVSHDFFGPNSNENTNARTHIYKSRDNGRTWEKIAEFNQFWGGLFFHNGALWIMGPKNNADACVIRKSVDGGKTWTEPTSENNGVLIKPELKDGNPAMRIGFHTAPCSLIIAKGRIWRAMESVPIWKWGEFSAFVMSAPIDADLLKASSWTISNKIKFPEELKDSSHWTWLEGNMIQDAKTGTIYNMLRVEGNVGDIAALLKVSDDGKVLSFDKNNFVRFPGASKKFVPRYNEADKKYYALSNYIPEEFRREPNGSVRNTLALVESDDLRIWRVKKVLLQRPDWRFDGFQYADWLFYKGEILFVSRTALFDGIENAHTQHDSNFITFHRTKLK